MECKFTLNNVRLEPQYEIATNEPHKDGTLFTGILTNMIAKDESLDQLLGLNNMGHVHAAYVCVSMPSRDVSLYCSIARRPDRYRTPGQNQAETLYLDLCAADKKLLLDIFNSMTLSCHNKTLGDIWTENNQSNLAVVQNIIGGTVINFDALNTAISKLGSANARLNPDEKLAAIGIVKEWERL